MVESLQASAPCRLDRVFHALSDPTRRSILRDIAKQEKTVGEIARPYRYSLAAISKHIQVLESSGLVTRRRQGSFRYVRITPVPLKEAQQWLSFYESFWNERLDALADLFTKPEKIG
ncbi:MAG: metalloregulator ArsR/SmtB family transcription factor [Acidobacteria bacterium]|nr:metalloregulator ArsR/SmtB family transcription factor [Acidobacteriota bacterium]